ncbi:MAG TPA: hypothetical protein VLQ93_14035, partial [Myxococcaceae bacterium]|nr:hypothetical protein [Myxococcaceae bacterium]
YGFDSVISTRVTPPALFRGLAGQEGAATVATTATAAATTQAVAVNIVRLSPVVLALLRSDEPDAGDLLQRELIQCAVLADEKINRKYFGDREPSPAECRKQVEFEVDGCAVIMSMAQLLGREKHEEALKCAREVLKKWWRAPFSIEQRYRYYPNAKFIETVSAVEEARLIKEGCTHQLKRTIKPDIVLHVDFRFTLAALIFDFKFPCLESRKSKPGWTEYGPHSAYAGSNQGRVYQEALGGRAYLISPTGVHP